MGGERNLLVGQALVLRNLIVGSLDGIHNLVDVEGTSEPLRLIIFMALPLRCLSETVLLARNGDATAREGISRRQRRYSRSLRGLLRADAYASAYLMCL